MKLNCEVVKDIYLLYKEGELSTNVTEAVKEHLDTCEECKMYFEEQDNYTNIIKKDNDMIEPSKKLDEKLKLKLKLRRLRVILIFISSILIIYSYFNYVDQRKTLLYELAHIKISASSIKNGLDKDIIGAIDDESQIILINSQYYDIIGNTQRIERNLNYFERKELNDMSTKNISPYFTLFIEKIYYKSIYGELTYEDKVALFKMERYFRQYEQLLTKEIAKIEAINNNYDIKAKFSTLNIAELDKLNRDISELSITYYKYNKLPEQIDLKSKQEIEEILKATFDTTDGEINLELNDYEPIYSLEIIDNDKHIFGGIDAHTGQFMNFINKSVSTEGEYLLSDDEAINILNAKLIRIFGDDLDYKITNLGLNYDFNRSNDVEYDYSFNNSEGIKLLTYRVIPVKNGYEINSSYIFRIDARTGDLAVMFLDYGINIELLNNAIQFNAPKTPLAIDDGYFLLAKDKGENGQGFQFEYTKTLYIRSKTTGNYELVHQFNSNPYTGYIRYVNAKTGKEDFIY